MDQETLTSGRFVSSVNALSSAVIVAAGHALMAHGEDPNSDEILLAGFCKAIDAINSDIDQTFKARLVGLLADSGYSVSRPH